MKTSFATCFFAIAVVCVQVVDEANAFASKSKAKAKSGRNTGGGGFGSSQKTTYIHTPDTGEKSQKLLEFLRGQKAKALDDVEIGFDKETGRRGLFCTSKIKKNQKFCRIPSDSVLALADPGKNGADAPTAAHRGANLLEMYMKNDQAKQLWSPYFDTLPTKDSDEFDRTPDFFADDDLELLEFPRVISRAKQRKKEIAEVAADRGLTEDELQYATWLTTSRQFRLYIPTPKDENDEIMPDEDEKCQIISKGGEKKPLYVLVPFIDIANHSSDQPNCKLTLIDPEKDDAWFALEATRPIAAGKELLIAYGNGLESSVELFVNYGFVPLQNKIDPLMLQKGGDDTISDPSGWTTTLEEDKTVIEMAKDDPILQKILQFRIRMKESYGN
mmetsp:Transcript_43842/g.91229  ORF Transcript_43842/g.91229 Transcript_43842/m.91229 type:complete len:387 (-) Transcript_43842:200-1360(-)|eukprot:CAMPEP_0201166660 /NCGR_PEP_ID=MMETSP0851-20130426/69264_1 /ASSEMBLY_ACC=CAM_ASM_000631 /TAXON_ID=183588 /ORGANISM="Pseudo-nitzschia fraudulenta, Strain WWA7" /LENGTH=386 /DNA_ID=CAMNT_0047447697 /DNA_START=233 /DNA_END=1393 /DNA_ORIENTATION=-